MTQEYNLLQALTDNIPDSIYFKDKKNRFIKVNKAKAERSGTIPEEMIGKTDFDFYPEEKAKKCFADDNWVMKSDKALINRVEKITLPHGKERWVSATKIPWHDEKGEVIGTMGISRDITEQKRAEEDLKKAHQELKETTAQLVHNERMTALGELTAGVAHELNQPLNNIKIVCQDLLRDTDKNRLDINELPQDLKDVIGQVNKMAEIIDHMRIFTRRLEGVRKEEININQPLNNMFKLIGEQLRVHNIEVLKDLEADLPKILGDPINLEQVFTNLMLNARTAVEDFRKKERRIKIKSFMINKKKVAVSIEDNGGGISLNIKERIFEPFFTTKPPGQGTGLGLSIAKKLIEEHKGRIEMEVEEGEGSTFTIILPISS